MALVVLPILAGAAMALPEMSADAFMRAVLRRVNGNDAALLELVIDDKREIRECAVLQSTFSDEESARICPGVVGVKYRSAATGPDGGKVYARTVLAFSLGKNALADPIDLIVRTEQIPAETNLPAETSVTVFAGSDGAIQQCEGSPDSDARLSQLACAQLSGLRLDPVVRDDGVAVPFVTDIKVRIEAAGE